MIKFITFLILLNFINTPSNASWTPLDEGTESVQSYIDFENVWRSDNYIYYWSLFDYLEPEYGTGMRSMRTYSRGDCLSFKYEILIALSYQKPMAKGKSRKLPVPEEWTYPKTSSLLGKNLNSLCFMTNIINLN